MKLYILLIGILIFFASLFLHIIIWRCRCPVNRLSALILIFILLPLIFVVGFMAFRWFAFPPDNINIMLIDWSAVYLLHFALACAYILGYPAVEAASPSITILLRIGASHASGLSYDDLLYYFYDELLLEPRIKDLIEAGLILESNNYLMITPRGAALIRSFMFLRHLLNLQKGKG